MSRQNNLLDANERELPRRSIRATLAEYWPIGNAVEWGQRGLELPR
jgi:hypothetical protein